MSRHPRIRKRFATRQAAKDWAAANVPAGIHATIGHKPQAGRGDAARKPWLVEYREHGTRPAAVDRHVTVADYAARGSRTKRRPS